MEKTVQGNFAEILKQVLVEVPEGRIDFRGPTEGFVSVTFIEGDILLIESAWGTGNDQLQRIYEWEAGTCIIRDLTAEEKKTLETKWQRPVILDQVKKETEDAISLEHPVEVTHVLQNLKGESLNRDAFLAEVQQKHYSGEAKITTQLGNNHILFYRGLPLLSSYRTNIAMEDVREIMNNPAATLNFYLLGDDLVRARFSVMQGEKVWEGLSVTVLHLDNMLDKLMEKNPTGHLCIQKESGDRHYCFFFQGKPLGVYDIEQHWRPVDISTMWEGAKQVDYYLSADMDVALSAAEEMSVAEAFKQFTAAWNDLVEAIAKKVGKKPVEKSLTKTFQGLDIYTLEGIRLRAKDLRAGSGYDALKTFRLKVPDFLKEMETITGRQWLDKQVQDLQKQHTGLVTRLSLTEALSRKGG